MKETMPVKSSRSFTKLFVAGNLFLIWVAILASIFTGQAEFVTGHGFALIGAIFGIYTGVGHLDYRQAIELSVDRLVKRNDRAAENAG